MREEVFDSWFRFARIWIPVSMTLILLAPSYTNDIIFPITKGTTSFALSVIFIIVSAAIVTTRSISIRKSKI